MSLTENHELSMMSIEGEESNSFFSESSESNSQNLHRIKVKKRVRISNPNSGQNTATAPKRIKFLIEFQPRRRRDRVPAHETLSSQLHALLAPCETANSEQLEAIKTQVLEKKDNEIVHHDETLRRMVEDLLLQISFRERELQSAETFKDNGNAYFGMKNFNDALRCYRKACELNSTKCVYFSNAAAALLKLERFEEAAKEAKKAIELDTTYLKAYLRLAQAQLLLGDTEGALKCTQNLGASEEVKLIETHVKILTSTLREVEELIASGLWAEGDMEKVREKIQRCKRYSPGSIRVKLLDSVIRMLMDSKNSNSSKTVLKKYMAELETMFPISSCMDLESVVVPNLNDISILLFNGGFMAEAHYSFYVARKMSPANLIACHWYELCGKMETLHRKASQCQDQGLYEDAISACNQLLALTANPLLNAKIHVLHAGCLFLLRKYSEAEMMCNKALTLSPFCFKAHVAKAHIYLQTAQFEKAERELKTVEQTMVHLLKPSHVQEIQGIRTSIRVKQEEMRKAVAAEEEIRANFRYKQEETRRAAAAAEERSREPKSSPKRRNSVKKENSIPQNNNNRRPEVPSLNTKASHYAILGVSKRATVQEIRKAYKDLARKYHPDKNNDPNAASWFVRVGEAHEVLLSPSRRRIYDYSHVL